MENSRDSNRCKFLKCCFAQRFVVGVMGCCCIMVAYILRVCLNIAITQMVHHKHHTKSHHGGNSTSFLKVHGEYKWSEQTQGIILGAFFYGYIVTHISSAFISDRFPPKQTLGIGMLITSVMAIVTPVVTRMGGNNPLGIIIVRVIQGLGEGPIMPAMTSLMSRWVVKEERGVMSALIFGGAQLGIILGTIVSGLILGHTRNWSLIFYFFGALGFAWCILWQVLVYNDPRTHPFISREERTFLESKIEKKIKKNVPWKCLLSSPAIWAVIIAAIGHDWGYMTMIADLPKYMNDVLKFRIEKTGFLSALPYVCMWIASFLFGLLCDTCIKRNYLSIKNARKIFTMIASIGPGVFIVGASYAGHNKNLAVILICIAMGLMGAYMCGMKVNALDLTPNYAGAATAIVFGIGGISGAIGPYVVGYLTPHQSLEEWRITFWISLVILTITGILYVLFAEGKVQWWNNIEKTEYPTSWKRKEQI